jgi:hypothetical protein
MGQGSHLMGTDRSDQPASPLTARTATVVVLSLGVAVVLGDAGVVTLAMPEILRDFGAQVWLRDFVCGSGQHPAGTSNGRHTTAPAPPAERL